MRRTPEECVLTLPASVWLLVLPGERASRISVCRANANCRRAIPDSLCAVVLPHRVRGTPRKRNNPLTRLFHKKPQRTELIDEPGALEGRRGRGRRGGSPPDWVGKVSGLVRGLRHRSWQAPRQGWKLRPVANRQHRTSSDQAECGQERNGSRDTDGELGGRRGGVQAQHLA